MQSRPTARARLKRAGRSCECPRFRATFATGSWPIYPSTGSDRDVLGQLKIDRFRIYPDTKPFAFKIVEIILLVPPDDSLVRGPES